MLKGIFPKYTTESKMETFWPFPKPILPHGGWTSPGRIELSLCPKQVRNGG